MTLTNRYIVDVVRTWWGRPPLCGGLRKPVWHDRHRSMLAILWLHAAGLVLYGSIGGHGWAAAAVSCMAVALPTLCASLSLFSPRVRSMFSAVAAFAASASLVHFSGGYIEAHFHFFVMVAALALYQSWLPFLVNITLVILHHGIAGSVFPVIVYNYPDAIAQPWIMTAIHGAFLLAEGAAFIGTWRISASVEADLKLSEDRIRLLTDASPIGIFQTDAEGHCLYKNLRCQEIMAQAADRDQASQENGLAVLGAEAMASWTQAIHEGREVELECSFMNSGGSATWVHLQSRPIFGPNGAIESHVGTIQDVTVRKQSEANTIQIAQRLELATRAANIGVWDWNLLTNQLLWDDRLFGVYGVDKADFSGAYEAWRATVHPDDVARSEAEIQQALRNEKPFDTEFRIIWPDGSVRIIKGEGHVTWDADGVPLRMTGVNYDITDLRQAQQELEARAAWQKAVLDGAGHGIICTKLDGVIETFNPAAERMLGYRAAEVVGRVTPAIIHDPAEVAERAKLFSLELKEQIEPGFEVFVAKSRKGLPNEHEWTYIRKDGTRFPVLLSVAAIRNAAGAIDGFMGIASDITASKEAAARLSAQYEMTKVLASAEPQEAAMAMIMQSICESLQWDMGALWLVDEPASVLRCVQTWHRFNETDGRLVASLTNRVFPCGLGLPGRVWEQKTTDWIADLRRERNILRQGTLAESGIRSAVAFPLRLSSGAVLGVMEFFSRRFRDPDEDLLKMLESIGSQIGLFLLNRRAEAQLRKSEALFVNVVDVSNDAIIAIDRSQRVLLFNQGAARIFGYTQAEMMGQRIDRLLPESIRARHAWLVEELFAAYDRNQGRGAGLEREIGAIRKNGDLFPAEAAFSIIDLAGERVATAVLRDISERKKIETMQARYRETLERSIAERTIDLEKAKEAAEQANRSKSEFLANMSHELRTPMHAILSFATLGIEKLETQKFEKVAQHLSRIKTSGTRLLTLLNDLLDLSKLSAGKMTYEMAPQNLVSLLGTAAEQLEPLIRQKELRLVIQGAEHPVIATCDGGRILQVLQNLLSNAIKFTPGGHNITVTIADHVSAGDAAAEESPSVSVTVSDEGVGIPESELDRVFDPFVQSSKTKSGAGGTGLGLAICQEIVQAHGGRIRAVNNSGGGASMTFTLPKAAALVTAQEQ